MGCPPRHLSAGKSLLCTLCARRPDLDPKTWVDLRLCWCAILGLNQFHSRVDGILSDLPRKPLTRRYGRQ
jgi:hypothetical protein